MKMLIMECGFHYSSTMPLILILQVEKVDKVNLSLAKFQKIILKELRNQNINLKKVTLSKMYMRVKNQLATQKIS
jgi:hypothetical protein